MAKGELLGRVNCPCCGLVDGLRVTEDKNGAPFGFCDAGCNYQMRVGGDAHRVKLFFENNPTVRRPGMSSPVPAVEPEFSESELKAARELRPYLGPIAYTEEERAVIAEGGEPGPAVFPVSSFSDAIKLLGGGK